MIGRERVVCRVCGDWGYEDAGDPCPGLCPPCFDAALRVVTLALVVDCERIDLSTARCMERHGRRLRGIGMPAPHVAQLLRRIEHDLTEQTGRTN